jgi:polyisoprenyl-phosphate glycosyltransferase
MSTPELSIVVPIYDEEDGIPELVSRLAAVMDELAMTAEVVFVDDGSRDKSPKLLEALSRSDPRFKAIRLSRNFGHQVAITAGLHHASGHAVVVMDGDLQDPPEVIPELVERWREGFEVVYAIRKKRQDERWYKRTAKSVFYRTLARMADVQIPVEVGDFRLVDRRVVDLFGEMREHNPYVRGMFSWLGFRQTGVHYLRDERHAGRSKYPLTKLIKLGLDGIIGFSDFPLRLALSVGFVMSTLAFLLGIAAIASKFGGIYVVPGWASLVVVISFLGGIQLALLGAVGLYVGRIYEEVKNRPLYVVDEVYSSPPEQRSEAIGEEEEGELRGVPATSLALGETTRSHRRA